MSFAGRALQDMPVALYMMDDLSPYQDYSGYNRVASASTTPPTHASVARGTAHAPVFSRSSIGSFEAPVFTQGKESESFSLEAVLKVIDQTTNNFPQTYRENRVRNPVFANDASSWQASQGTVTRSTAWFNRGGASGLFTTAASGITTSCGPWIAGDGSSGLSGFVVKAGQNVRILATIEPIINMAIRPYIAYFDSQGTLIDSISTPVGERVQGTASIPCVVDRTWVAPAGTANAYIRLLSAQTDGSTVLPVSTQAYYIDSAGIYVSDAPDTGNYFDGSMPGYEWAGTANDSVSRSMSGVSRVNLATAASHEANTGAYVNNSTITTSSYDSTYYRRGAKSARSTRVAGQTASPRVVASMYSSGMHSSGMIPVSPGETFTYSYNVRVGQGTGYEAYCGFYFYRDGVNITSNAGTTIPVAIGTWEYRPTITVTIPSGINGIRTMVGVQKADINGVAADGDYVNVDCHLLERGSQLLPYFDGSETGSEWRGTAHQSESYLLTSNGEQQILGNQNQADGLTVNGTKVSFVTRYLTTGEARATYDIQQDQKIHAVGVHTRDKNSLYVNGELVAEATISEEQQGDTFVATSSSLYTGASLSSQAVALGAVGVYAKALPAEAIAAHHLVNTELPTPEEVVEAYGGKVIPVSLSNAEIFTDQWWTTAEDWESAVLQNVVVEDDALVPQIDETGVSLPGQWLDSFALDTTDDTSIYGVIFDWDGQGVTVEGSLNGVDWETIVRGVKPAVVPNGTNPTDKELQIRVTFTGGTVDDTSFLDNLNVVGLKGSTAQTNTGRTVTQSNAAPGKDYPTLLMHDNWGTRLLTGGNLVINPDTSDEALPVRTLEIWYKATDGDGQFGLGTTASALYRNGVAGSANTKLLGQWQHYVKVITTDRTDAITIPDLGQIGMIAVYPTALTAQNVADIYNTHVGNKMLVQNDSSVVSMLDVTPTSRIYAYDWEIQATG